MSKDLKGVNAKITARRRLVRGVFAAPAALTLCSGSVFAATSNALRCVQYAVANAPVAVLGAADKTWARVEVWILESGDTGGSTWVSGADLAFLARNRPYPPYLYPNEWQCLSVRGENPGYTLGQRLNPDQLDPAEASKFAYVRRSGEYVAVRVDESGNIIGVEGIEKGGTAVSLLCWNSLAPTA